jgi:uncharacterized membrane protein
MSEPLRTPSHTPGTTAGYAQRWSGSGLGIASLVFGILALLSSWLLAGLFFGSFAVVLGVFELDRVARGAAKTRRGMAVVGMVLGVVAIVISLVALGFKIWFIS